MNLKDMVVGGGLPDAGRYVVTEVKGEHFQFGQGVGSRLTLTMDRRDEESGESAGYDPATFHLTLGQTQMAGISGGYRFAQESGIPFQDVDSGIQQDAGTILVMKTDSPRTFMRGSVIHVFLQNLFSAAGNEPDNPLRGMDEMEQYEGGCSIDLAPTFLGLDITLASHVIKGNTYTDKKSGQEKTGKDFNTLVPVAYHGYVDLEEEGGGEAEAEEEKKPAQTKGAAGKDKGKKQTEEFDPTPDTDLPAKECAKDWVTRGKAAGLSPKELASMAQQVKVKFKPNQSAYKMEFTKLTETAIKVMK